MIGALPQNDAFDSATICSDTLYSNVVKLIRVVTTHVQQSHGYPMISALAFYRWGGLALAGLGLPLALRFVPPNPIYGARLPQSFASPANWYSINARAGALLSSFGLCLFAVSYPLAQLLTNATRQSRAFALVLPAFVLLGIVRSIRRFAAQFDRAA